MALALFGSRGPRVTSTDGSTIASSIIDCHILGLTATVRGCNDLRIRVPLTKLANLNLSIRVNEGGHYCRLPRIGGCHKKN